MGHAMSRGMDNKLCDPRPYLRHQALAIEWLRSNGKKATELQVIRLMHRTTADDLERMLTERKAALRSFSRLW